MDNTIELIARMIDEADRVVTLTGSGISTESGIPDFRSPGGLWTRFDPAIYATYESFVNNPSKFWEMSAELNPLLDNAEPNPAHLALVDLENLGKCDAVITQNIDNLHQRAGSSDVLELHGTYRSGTCLSCLVNYDYEYFKEKVLEARIPRCNKCNGLVKPDVVLFGEPLNSHVLKRAVELACSSDLMLVVGCGLEIYPAASLPTDAHRNGVKLIFINLGMTTFDSIADMVIRGKAGEILPEIVDAYKTITGKN